MYLNRHNNSCGPAYKIGHLVWINVLKCRCIYFLSAAIHLEIFLLLYIFLAINPKQNLIEALDLTLTQYKSAVPLSPLDLCWFTELVIILFFLGEERTSRAPSLWIYLKLRFSSSSNNRNSVIDWIHFMHVFQQQTWSLLYGNYPYKYLIRQCWENEQWYHKRDKNLARI